MLAHLCPNINMDNRSPDDMLPAEQRRLRLPKKGLFSSFSCHKIFKIQRIFLKRGRNQVQKRLYVLRYCANHVPQHRRLLVKEPQVGLLV